MQDWQEVRAWRRSTRANLLSHRITLSRDEKHRIRTVLGDLICEQFPELRHGCIGFYWPFKGEIDLRHLVRALLAAGAEAALPVVVENQQPLEFWAWHPRTKLRRGIWNIPVPAEPNPVRPTALLVPLLGFDMMGYRLGYGGGYYDRTLAAIDPQPLTIGVGYELGRLNTIYPQPHDIPLDAIVTERGSERFRQRGMPLDGEGRPDAASVRRADEMPGLATKEARARTNASRCKEGEVRGCASPPCFMHELDPTYLG